MCVRIHQLVLIRINFSSKIIYVRHTEAVTFQNVGEVWLTGLLLKNHLFFRGLGNTKAGVRMRMCL